MATAEAIARRIDTADDLRSIVRTMKALAAVNIRQYDEAAAALCGLFAGRLARLSGAVSDSARLDDRNRPPDAVLALPAPAAGIAPLVLALLERVAGWREAGTVDAVRLYFNVPRGRAGYQPHEEQLLPLDPDELRRRAAAPWRPRAWPTIAGDWDALFSAVVEQHLFVTLHGAIAESLAAENASRLAAMHAAERNIDERLHVLRGQFHRERQAAITTELLDIVSDYEALTAGGSGRQREHGSLRPVTSLSRTSASDKRFARERKHIVPPSSEERAGPSRACGFAFIDVYVYIDVCLVMPSPTALCCRCWDSSSNAPPTPTS